jgi:hypothetical protein
MVEKKGDKGSPRTKPPVKPDKVEHAGYPPGKPPLKPKK